MLSQHLSLASGLSLLAVLGQIAADSSVYFSLESADASVYYDLSKDDACYDAPQFGGAGWSDITGMTGPNAAAPACESVRGLRMDEIGLGTPLAFNNILVDNNLADWCGRIVKIYKADGSEYTLPTGPFFIWDGCGACSTRSRIDLSSEGILGLQDQQVDGTTGCDNPSGLKVDVMNEYFWKAMPGGVVDESPDPAENPTGTFAGPIPAKVTTNGYPAEYQPTAGSEPPVYTAVLGPGAGGRVPDPNAPDAVYQHQSAAGTYEPTGTAGGASATLTANASGSATAGVSQSAQSAPGASRSILSSSPGASQPAVTAVTGGQTGALGQQAGATGASSVPGAASAGPAGSSVPVGPGAGGASSISGAPSQGSASYTANGAGAQGASSASALGAAGSSAGNINAVANSASPLAGGSSAGAAGAGGSSVVNINAVATSGASTTAASADCQAGAFRCQGGRTEVCNFITSGQSDLGWVFHTEGCGMFDSEGEEGTATGTGTASVTASPGSV